MDKKEIIFQDNKAKDEIKKRKATAKFIDQKL
jgi:hypothetical protein